MRTAPSLPSPRLIVAGKVRFKHGDSCIHLHSNGSMLGACYWFHHNLVAAPGSSVGSKDDVTYSVR